MSTKFHLPGLNGLRAIAALAVVLSHTLKNRTAFDLPELTQGLGLARYGVTIFFALSGFLITYLLLLEKEKDGSISIKSFYIRRILRIWPLYYLYLIVAVLVILLLNVGQITGNIWFLIFFSANVPFILNASLPLLNHYWSLGVEEQFYLFWPWIIKKTSRLVYILMIFIGVFLMAKVACNLIARNGILWPYRILEVTKFDCMAIGGLGAIFSYRKNPIFLRLVWHPVVEIVAWGVILLVLFDSLPVYSVIANEIIAVVTVILIMNVSLNSRRIIGLDYPIFNFLGKISYGIYVIHPIAIFAAIRFLPKLVSSLSPFNKYLIFVSFVFICTIFLAWLSYEFIEKKFLRAKEKFASIPSSSTNPSSPPKKYGAKVVVAAEADYLQESHRRKM